MLSRRMLMTGCVASVLSVHRDPAQAQAVLNDDGLYTQPWFLQSFLEFSDDLQSAKSKGKRLAIMWELRGCPYCKETHLVNFAKPEIERYVKERFEILQLNFIGAREVVDFDGEKLTEKQIAQKYGIRFTPTFQFFAESAAQLGSKKPREREVLRTQGYLEPPHFLAMFRYVAERAYEKGSLRDFIKANS
jgi:thioredoxin-related protein